MPKIGTDWRFQPSVQEAVDLIGKYEGCYLKAYRSFLGRVNGVAKYDVPTIGFGHTTEAGPPEVKMGDVITHEQALAILKADLKIVEVQVGQLVKVPLGANEAGALVSFTYNLGPGALKSSSLLRRLNAGDYGVGNEFGKWIYAQGVQLQGLILRRAAEAALWNEPPLWQQVVQTPGIPNHSGAL